MNERMSQGAAFRATGVSRRGFLTGVGGVSLLALGSPALLAACGDGGTTGTTGTGLEAYRAASIDWQQAKGRSINIAVIPATYFEVLFELLPQFEELTGIKVSVEKIPPAQIRQKAVLDLSTGGKQYHTHAADPMYYPLYASNKWVVPIDDFLGNAKYTDQKWFAFDDIIPKWRGSTTIDGKTYGVPYDGEVTVQVYRTDLYDKAGLKPAETLDQFLANAGELNHPDKRIWGAALRGTPGAGQNMYIWPSIFREYGGEWFDTAGQPTVNSDAGVAALEWYIKLMGNGPKAASNWNWPDIADAFAQGTLASFIDAHAATALVVFDKQKSRVVDSVGFARWPAGPTGKRVTSLWNWSFPINAAVPPEEQLATWLFIQWATSLETQARTSYAYKGSGIGRSGVNRTSLWKLDTYRKSVDYGNGFLDAVETSLAEDTDLDWRPRVPEWPAIGDRMAIALQTALTGQKTAKAALDDVSQEIVGILGKRRS